MSYRKIMEKMAISSRQWIPIDRLGLDEKEMFDFAQFVGRESGGFMEVLYDRHPETGDIYAMLAMRFKSVPEGDIRRNLGIDRYALSFLLFVLFEEIQGKSYVSAEDVVHVLAQKGITKENLSLKKFVSKLESAGLIFVKNDEETGFLFVRPTTLLRRLIDTAKVAESVKDIWSTADEKAIDKVIGRDSGETTDTED